MDDLALTVDEKFGEIPFDRLGPQNAGRFVLEPGVERMGVVAIDLDLGKERERDIETGLAELPMASASPGSCSPNWLQGKPRTTKSRSLKLRYSSSRPVYCGVKPHWLAVFTMSRTLPR
jgi:hypothetical protein